MSIPPDEALRCLSEGNSRFRADPYIETGALEGHAPRKLHNEEESVAYLVSPEDLMRFFDLELSEAERRMVARQVSASKYLQDELAFLEFVRSHFQDIRSQSAPSDGLTWEVIRGRL